MYPIGRYSDDTLALQRALSLNGFDIGKAGPDGKMGDDTIKAIVAAREHYGLENAHQPRIDVPLLLALGVRSKAPTPPPRSNPLKDWLIGLAIKQVASKLKGLPMLSGAKTYITAAVLAVVAVYSLIFGDLPGVGHVDPSSAIMELLASLGLVFGRAGAKADAKKVADE